VNLPETLLVTGARAPVALHLTRLLAGAGHRVLLADSLRWPLAGFSAQKAGYTRIPPLRFQRAAAGHALADLVRREGVGLILPTCEEIFHLAHLARANALPCPLFAPPLSLLREAHHKYEFIARCQALGLPVPQTTLLQSADAVGELARDSRTLVFKPVWSRFAAKVLVRPEAEALRAVRPRPEAPWIAQSYLPGEEISLWAMAHHGELRAMAAYRALARAGQGAAICCERVEGEDIRNFAATYVKGTGWHGQISFDLRRDAAGVLHAIECNPRATSGLHFFRQPAGFAAAFGPDGQAVHPDVTGPQGVRAAMLAWGAGRLAKAPRAFISEWRSTREMTAWAGDPPGLAGQIAALAEFAATALRHGISLQEASTRDIEWNGEDAI